MSNLMTNQLQTLQGENPGAVPLERAAGDFRLVTKHVVRRSPRSWRVIIFHGVNKAVGAAANLSIGRERKGLCNVCGTATGNGRWRWFQKRNGKAEQWYPRTRSSFASVPFFAFSALFRGHYHLQSPIFRARTSSFPA
jgi:hypothetical protein